MATIIAIACHKGGTGKTTTTRALAGWFNLFGQRTFAIDLDPLATLTRTVGLGVGGPTIADVMLGEYPLFDAFRGASPGISVVSADKKLIWAAAYMQAQSPNHNFLRNALRGTDGLTALIDCPPSAGILIVNALVAATHVIIPVEPEDEAIDGMLHMLAMVEDCRDLGNGATVVGAVITRANLNVLRHTQNIERIEQELTARGLSVLGVVPLRQGQDAAFQYSRFRVVN